MQLELPFGSSIHVEKPGGRNALPIRHRAIARGEQLVLPGCGIRQLENLFFCLRLPSATADQADNLARQFSREHDLRGPLRGAQLYHVTLHGLGMFDTVPRALAARAVEAVQSVSMPCFNVRFDRIVSFANIDNHPLVLLGGSELSKLREFHARLGSILRNAGFKRIQKSFTPHVTLLYDSRLVPETAVPPVSWTVRNFALVHSPYGQSRHDEVASFELAGCLDPVSCESSPTVYVKLAQRSASGLRACEARP
jgi:2'-5' RNA ligase